MHKLDLTPDHPITLPLAADSRLCNTSYTNDQIWELNLGNTEPPVISLQTTFGLRAKICRIFPRFIIDDLVISDPSQFVHPVSIQSYHPNYISFSFSPFLGINVFQEYWVPDSQSVAGRTRVSNASSSPISLKMEWSELLVPAAEGKRMSVTEMGMGTILSGETGDLCPVFFISGGAIPGNGPYSSLVLTLDLPPYSEKLVRWVNAASMDVESSFEKAKWVNSQNWDAEFSRIRRTNAGKVEISCGEAEWNLPFNLAQLLADQLILGPTNLSPAPSFVLQRNPDQGYSLRQDGSDYNHLWNGQSPLDAYYLSNFLLPCSPELVRGMLDNFLATQLPEGDVDGKPGMAGQRSHLLATPLLANLAWKYYEYSADADYLKTIFPKLLANFHSWFKPLHDRDQDGFPEWDQPVQTGIEDFPLYSAAPVNTFSVDISTLECPDLASYLFSESTSLLSIAHLLGEQDSTARIMEMQGKLASMIESAWSEEDICYHYRDRDTHASHRGEVLGTRMGAGILELERSFDPPIRPVLRLESGRELTHPTQIFIHGIGINAVHRVEVITANRVHWQLGIGYVTSEYAYSSIERIEVNGIQPDARVEVGSADHLLLDESLLLPLWAGIPTDERARVLINLTIMNKKKFLSPYGVRPVVGINPLSGKPEDFPGTHLPLTAMLLEGLVRYGERRKAAEIFIRLMNNVVRSMKTDWSFYQSYHLETGKPSGAKNILSGLVPVNVFLNILGVKIFDPTRVEITDRNPFPLPVTLKYRGLTVIKQEKKSLIIFPDGQNVTVSNNQKHLITLDKL